MTEFWHSIEFLRQLILCKYNFCTRSKLFFFRAVVAQGQLFVRTRHRYVCPFIKGPRPLGSAKWSPIPSSVVIVSYRSILLWLPPCFPKMKDVPSDFFTLFPDVFPLEKCQKQQHRRRQAACHAPLRFSWRLPRWPNSPACWQARPRSEMGLWVQLGQTLGVAIRILNERFHMILISLWPLAKVDPY